MLSCTAKQALIILLQDACIIWRKQMPICHCSPFSKEPGCVCQAASENDSHGTKGVRVDTIGVNSRTRHISYIMESAVPWSSTLLPEDINGDFSCSLSWKCKILWSSPATHRLTWHEKTRRPRAAQLIAAGHWSWRWNSPGSAEGLKSTSVERSDFSGWASTGAEDNPQA